MQPFRLVCLAVVVIAAALGCSPSEDKTKTAEAPAASDGKLVEHRDANGNLFCPVMKQVIDRVDLAAGHVDYEGKRYYVCCAVCLKKFNDDPAKYASR